jgi:hypothetical protein
MYASTVGIMVFVVFGTQSDLLSTWAFWRKPSAPPIAPPLPSARSPKALEAFLPSPIDSDEIWEERERKGSIPDVGIVGLGLSKAELSDEGHEVWIEGMGRSFRMLSAIVMCGQPISLFM